MIKAAKPQNTDLKEIHLKPDIYDFTDPIREYLINNTPLTGEQVNVLRTFKESSSLEDYIKERGREVILNEFNEASSYFNFEEAKVAVREGLSLAQKINPDVKIEAFPVIFLFNPKYGDATALHGQGCAINIKALKDSKYSKGSPYEKIVSFVAHESTHLFLKQLDKKPPPFYLNKDPLENGMYKFLWEEGLTTYIEPLHYRHHEVIVEDADFWINIINDWLKTNDINLKTDLLNKCIQRPSGISWFKDMHKEKELPSFKNLNENQLDSIFLRMLREANGPGYHIGSYLWEKQIKEGKNLKDLVMAGSESMEDWIKEES